MVRIKHAKIGKYEYIGISQTEQTKEIDEKQLKELNASFKEKLTPRIAQLLDIINSSENNLEIIEACVELSTLVPNNFTADISKARAYAKLKEIDKAEKLFKTIIEKTNKKSGEAYFYYAHFLSDTGRHQDAIKCFDMILSIGTNDANAMSTLNHKGIALAELGEYQEAIKCYDLVLSENKNSVDALNNKAGVLANLGEYREAIKCLDRGLSIDGNNDSALDLKGFAHNQLGEYREAIKCFDRALSINGNNVSALNNKSVSLTNLEEYQEAKKYTDRALSIDENNVVAWSAKGVLHIKDEKPDEAIKCFDRALSIDGKYDSALHNKGIVLGAIGSFDEAIKCLKKSLSIKDSDVTRERLDFYIEKQNQSQKENTKTESEDNESQWIEITIQYPAKCKECKKDVVVGDRELWKKGEGVKHVKCNYEQNGMNQK